MEKEQILDFTRRISQSNRSGLTVINYEIIFAYLDDAKKAYQEEKWEEFKVALSEFLQGGRDRFLCANDEKYPAGVCRVHIRKR